MEEKKFYLGLDIGTDSVGFAVTDENYRLVRKGGKHLWGARLFEEAKDASTRRMSRAARRRYQRRRARLLLLRDLFKEEMDKVDPLFFKRLDSSSLHEEDKAPGIAKKHFYTDDLEFYKSYKTIYHLRKALLTEDRPFDIRLVYLAIAHMIKYRGNFLREGNIASGGVSPEEIEVSFNRLDELLDALFGSEGEVGRFSIAERPEAAGKLIELFKADSGVSKRAEDVADILFGGREKGTRSTIIAFLSGGKRKLSDFFPRLKDDNPETAKTSISMDMEDFEDAIFQYGLSDEENSLLIECKRLADDFLLVNLLKGKDSITDAMIAVYDAYREDLKNLRTLTKALRDHKLMGSGEKGITYGKFWNGTTGVTFLTFTGSSGHKGGKEPEPKDRCKYEDFAKSVAELCARGEGIEGLEGPISALKARLQSGKLFERQNSKHNGVFPYQLNETELRTILEKQGRYHPFLLAKDKGFPNPEKPDFKIVSLLRYRIPYYVGPLSNPEEGKELPPNHWVVKKDMNVKITPWNFFDVVDRSKTARAFMDNLRNRCSYIRGEETLPKCSLTFQLFKVLNELNNLALNARPLTFEEKNYLLENVYLVKKAVKPADLREALKTMNACHKVRLSTRNESGEEKLENMLKGNLSSWIALEKVLRKGFYKDRALYEKGEKIIETVTAFEDRATREEALSDFLSTEEAAAASKLTFKDYAPLSAKLLTGLKENVANVDTGEIVPMSILDLLYKTNDNFMEIYEGEKYSFRDQVLALNKASASGESSNPLKEMIDDAYVSPGMKRALFQTFHIVDELKKILKIDAFAKVFVECTRSSGEKKMTKSRKKAIEEYLGAAVKELKDEARSLMAQLEGKTEDELRSKRLYLYFMQLGRDVYTGQEIALERLSTDYDIDHIIPQALVKDDSFMNTVLTLRSKNNSKSKDYPIDSGFIAPEGKEWIRTLNRIKVGNMKLMPDEKMNRLLRQEPLRDEEILGFVNRQLVYTSQAVKAVCDIFKILQPATEVIYSKAALVSEFRGMFRLPKVRDLNDFHHANDAYLNIVVGDVYNQKFNSRATRDWIKKINSEEDGSYKAGPEWIFRHLQRSRDRKRTIWIPSAYVKGPDGKEREVEQADSTIKLVRKTLSWNDPMITHALRFQSGTSGFFNKISYVRGRESTDANFPLKKVPEGVDPVAWMQKYGSYKSMITPYFSLVSYKKGKRTFYSLEGLPSIVTVGLDDEQIADKLVESLANNGLKDPKTIVPVVPIRTIVSIPSDAGEGGVKLAISGRSEGNIICINASEPTMDEKHRNYYKMVCNIIGSNAPAGGKKDLSRYKESEGRHLEEIVEGEQRITRQGNFEFFDYIVNNLYERPCYKELPSLKTQFALLKDHHSKFDDLPTIGQCLALCDLVKLVTCKSVSKVNLNARFHDGLTADCGTIRISKNLKPGTKLIRTSFTGYYEKTIFEVPEE